MSEAIPPIPYSQIPPALAHWLTALERALIQNRIIDIPSTGSDAMFNTVTVASDVTVGGTVDGRNVSTDGAKLDAIEAGATADQTAPEVPVVDSGGLYVATDVEGALAEVMTDVQAIEADYLASSDIANMLETSDIGSTVQAYDADTTKNDVANVFTETQTTSKSFVSSEDISDAFQFKGSWSGLVANGASKDFASGSGLIVCQVTGTGDVALVTVGGGTIRIVSGGSAWVIGSPGVGEIGFEFISGTTYRVTNNTGAAQTFYFTGIATRDAV